MSRAADGQRESGASVAAAPATSTEMVLASFKTLVPVIFGPSAGSSEEADEVETSLPLPPPAAATTSQPIGIVVSDGCVVPIIPSGSRLPVTGTALLTTRENQARVLIDIRYGHRMFSPAACVPIGGTSRLVRVASAAQRGVKQLFLSVTLSRDGLNLEARLVDVLASSTAAAVNSRHRFTLSSVCPRRTLLDRTAEGSGVDVPVGAEIGSARFSKFLPDLWRYDNVYVDQRTSPHSRFTFHLPSSTQREDLDDVAAAAAASSTRPRLEPVVIRVAQNVAAISDREQDEVAPHATASRVWPCAYVLAKTVEALCCTDDGDGDDDDDGTTTIIETSSASPPRPPSTGTDARHHLTGDRECSSSSSSSLGTTEVEMLQEAVQVLVLALRRPRRRCVKSIELGCGLALPSLLLSAHLQRTMPKQHGLVSDLEARAGCCCCCCCCHCCVLATELPENLPTVQQQIFLNAAAVVGCSHDTHVDDAAAAAAAAAVGCEGDDAVAAKPLIQAVSCNWMEPPAGLVKQFIADGGADVILCADCVFWPWLFQPLVRTLRRLAVKGTVVLLAVKERLGSRAKDFLQLLRPHFVIKPLDQLPPVQQRQQQQQLFRSVAGIAERLDVQILACCKRPPPPPPQGSAAPINDPEIEKQVPPAGGSGSGSGGGGGGGGGKKTTSRQRKREWQHNRERVSRLAHLAPLHLVLDLGFTAQLSPREQKSLATQAIILYSEVRKCDAPVHLVLASCDTSLFPAAAPGGTNDTSQRGSPPAAEGSAMESHPCGVFYKTLARNDPAQWDQSLVSFVLGSISSMVGAEKNGVHVTNDVTWCCSTAHAGESDGDDANVVYLSPDADQLLTRVRPGTTYVFGGIVDRTHAKNLSKQKADSVGVSCARLPLREFGAFPASRPCVLNIDAAARILLEVYVDMHARHHHHHHTNVGTNDSSEEGCAENDEVWQESWRRAIEKHLPQRLLAEEQGKLSARSPLPRSVTELNGLSKSQIGALNMKNRLFALRPRSFFSFHRTQVPNAPSTSRWKAEVTDNETGASLGVGLGQTATHADGIATWHAIQQLLASNAKSEPPAE